VHREAVEDGREEGKKMGEKIGEESCKGERRQPF